MIFYLKKARKSELLDELESDSAMVVKPDLAGEDRMEEWQWLAQKEPAKLSGTEGGSLP